MTEFPAEKLDAYPIVAFLTTTDPAKAKAFYGDKLGLKFVSEDGFAVVFRGHGTTVRITIMKSVTPLQHTVLGWEVPDAGAAVQMLRDAGVTFEIVPGLQQDELGIWSAPGGAKVAWFKDPEGHFLSLSQHS